MVRLPLPALLALLGLFGLFGISGCAKQPSVSTPDGYTHDPGIAPVWRPLVERLEHDGINGPEVDAYFLALPPQITRDPMGRKVREIYTKTFLRPVAPPKDVSVAAPVQGGQKAEPARPRKPRVYKGVVTENNAQRCRDFLAAHSRYFARARQEHGIPPEILVSLLFVETRLGTAIGGGANALYTLASMASSTRPGQIPDRLAELPDDGTHRDWREELMRKRSEWAYKEVKALVLYARRGGLDMKNMPGSYYGAVGYCQFMPTNIEPYGVDADGDGIVNLFDMGDAIASVANFLGKHGWKAGLNRKGRHAVLKRYNHVDIYADTILELSNLVNSGRKRPG